MHCISLPATSSETETISKQVTPPATLHDSSASTAALTNSTVGDEPIPAITVCHALKNEYNAEILDHYLVQQAKSSVSACLQNHVITAEYRAKMVDWMTEVTSKTECNPATLHSSVKIMDRFLKHTWCRFRGSDLHLIGVVSMMIASSSLERPWAASSRSTSRQSSAVGRSTCNVAQSGSRAF